MMKMNDYKSTDEYISNFPDEVQAKLQQIRKAIAEAAPDAKEKISYGIPTFTFHGNLVHFAAYDTHIGFYPGADGVAEFKDQLKEYETSKGTVRIPLDKPLPLALIQEITVYRVARNSGKE